jgi:hypothetical protein
MSWIFLNNTKKSQYVDIFAEGSGDSVTSYDDFVYESSNDPIVLRGILKTKLIKRCWQDNRTFYYFDTGYFGNEISATNPNGHKFWHRIVKNNLQHGEIITRPDDRWLRLGKTISSWKPPGRKIIIAAPDEKPCKFYGINLEQWLEETVNTIKQHTDRPIVIRQRPADRIDRKQNIPLVAALQDDVFALVTFNSVASTEAILNGIPAFTLAPANASSPVSLQDLTKIETPYYPDRDKLYAWACHLAYGQFHTEELRNGTAKHILEDLT